VPIIAPHKSSHESWYKYFKPTYFSGTLTTIADLPQLHNAATTSSNHPAAAVMTRICHLSIECNAVNNGLQVRTHPRLVPPNGLLQPDHTHNVVHIILILCERRHYFFQCSDTFGWVTATASGHRHTSRKTCATYSPEVLFHDRIETEPSSSNCRKLFIGITKQTMINLQSHAKPLVVNKGSHAIKNNVIRNKDFNVVNLN